MKKSKFLGRKISLVTERKPAFEPHLLLTPSVVNVNHQKLIDLDVVSEQQLLLMKRVIERRILDCILASDYIKACIAFGSSITKSDIKLF
ncbi:T3SS regulon anti-activator ExsD domain-containing protein [Shewanella woodyi]|uniref:T3SS regulon anti-activator ExsD domain-containing protein n=1 Tax=Shewanella woodyi TaxID=60961 RepID=UPI00374944CC